MRSLRLFLLLLSVVFINTTLIGQNCKNDWGVLCTPTIFNQQNSVSFIKDLDKGLTTVEDYLDDSTSQHWIVFSDRWHNKLKNSKGGINTGDELGFMQQCLVKEVSGNWLWLFDFKDPKKSLGWIESKYILLSKFSLKTDDAISVPKKAMILTSLDALKTNSTILEDINDQKHFYRQPQIKLEAKLSSPKDFKIYFVYKETRNSVLLGDNDQLNGNVITVGKNIMGWIPKANVTDWNTRVCLEPSRSRTAYDVYGEKNLFGFTSIKDLNNCLNYQICSEESAVVQFQVGDIPANQMRMPILKNVDKNIKEIVSIASNKIDCDGCDTITNVHKMILERLKKKASTTNIIFAIDATTSMRFVYPKVAESVAEIIENNERLNQHSLKFGLLTYKDYCDPQPYNIVKLTTNHERVTDAILEEQCKSASCDRTFAEGQYNALINGINQFNLDPEQSNVIVLIGDCGNHEVYGKSIPSNQQYEINEVISTFFENKLNIISYQVNLCDDEGDSYYKFNDDSQEFISGTASKIAQDSPTLKPKLIDLGGNTYKLDLKEEGRIDFNNMFGRFTFASNKPMDQSHLKESIVKSMTEYMSVVDSNILVLSNKGESTGPEGTEVVFSTPPEGLIIYIMSVLKCDRERAIDFLTRNEITTKANVTTEYSEGVKVLVPVVFLSSSEKGKLDKSLRSMFVDENLTKAEKKMMFQKNIISVAQNILGDGVSEKTIKSYSMNELWNVILGIDYADKRVRDLKLDELTDLTKNFKLVFEDFTNKAKEYLETDYQVGDRYKKRSFMLNGEEFFWVPLEDLPGSKTL